MNIGKLNKRVSYTMTGTATADAYGGTTVTAGTAVSTWASARPMSMVEVLRNGLPDGSISYMFGFHYGQGKNINRGTKITYNSKVYIVNSVIEVNEEKQYVEVTATRQA